MIYPTPSVYGHKDQFIVGVQVAILNRDVRATPVPLVDLERDLGQGSALVSVYKDIVQGVTCQVGEEPAGDDDGVVLTGQRGRSEHKVKVKAKPTQLQE